MTYTSAADAVWSFKERIASSPMPNVGSSATSRMYAAVALSMPNQSGRSRSTVSQSCDLADGSSISTTLIGLREPSSRRRRLRRPPRRSACGSRGACGRRGRARRPVGRRAGAAPPATPPPRTRTTAAPRAAARRRPTRATVSSTSPPTSSARRSARARTASTGSWSIRSTGTSSRVDGSSASANVPSSAASVSLSARSARWSG